MLWSLLTNKRNAVVSVACDPSFWLSNHQISSRPSLVYHPIYPAENAEHVGFLINFQCSNLSTVLLTQDL